MSECEQVAELAALEADFSRESGALKIENAELKATVAALDGGGIGTKKYDEGVAIQNLVLTWTAKQNKKITSAMYDQKAPYMLWIDSQRGGAHGPQQRIALFGVVEAVICDDDCETNDGRRLHNFIANHKDKNGFDTMTKTCIMHQILLDTISQHILT